MIATYPKRKQYPETAFEYGHKTSGASECQQTCLTYLTLDPISYFKWFESVRILVEEQGLGTMLVLQHYPKDIDNDEEYVAAVTNSIKASLYLGDANTFLKDTLLNSIDPQLRRILNGMSFGEGTATEAFEQVKQYFSERINAFYFLGLESQLKFDITNVLQFLRDIDMLAEVYSFAFRGRAQMTPELKLQWIMNALNGNQEVLLDIQCDWENIVKNPDLLRSILTRHLNKAKRIRWSLFDEIMQ